MYCADVAKLLLRFPLRWGSRTSELNRRRKKNYPAKFLVGLILEVAMAELSYRFVETPFLRLKSKFGQQDAAIRAALADVSGSEVNAIGANQHQGD